MKNLALLTLAFAVAGCGSAKKEEVIGSYHADRGYGKETLDLKADGTYEQAFVSSGSTQKASARWTYYPENSHVVLDDVLLFDDGWGGSLLRQSGLIAALLSTSSWEAFRSYMGRLHHIRR